MQPSADVTAICEPHPSRLKTSQFNFHFQESVMRSLLLLFLGIPIPIIILIALFT